ncbi:MAG: ABC transporter permease [Micromonosporaceae bacterium]
MSESFSEPSPHPGVVAQQARSFLGLLLRDFSVLRNHLSEFLLRTLAQPVLFVFVFAYLFPRIGQGIGAGGSRTGFASVLVPGLVAVTAVFAGVSTVSLPLAIEFGATREIEDRVMAPLPVWAIATEKLVFGALQSLLSALLVLPLCLLISASAITIDVRQPGLLILVVVLACWISGALGLAVGTIVAPERMGLAFSVLVVPLTFLGCVYYPWFALAPIRWLQIAVLANPVVYLAEGLRATLVPDVPHMPATVYLGVGTALALALTAVGLRLFARRVAI